MRILFTIIEIRLYAVELPRSPQILVICIQVVHTSPPEWSMVFLQPLSLQPLKRFSIIAMLCLRRPICVLGDVHRVSRKYR